MSVGGSQCHLLAFTSLVLLDMSELQHKDILLPPPPFLGVLPSVYPHRAGWAHPIARKLHSDAPPVLTGCQKAYLGLSALYMTTLLGLLGAAIYVAWQRTLRRRKALSTGPTGALLP